MAAVQTQQDLVNQLIEIISCDAREAEHLLGACDNNFHAAIALHFEQNGENGAAESAAMASSANDGTADGDDGVRAPIAPIQEQLFPTQHDFFASTSSSSSSAAAAATAPTSSFSSVAAGRSTKPIVKFCPLRDFKREGELMEAQLRTKAASSATATAAPATNEDLRGLTNLFSNAQPFRHSWSKLGDLFRPPTELIYAGNFQSARTYATKQQRWLLVNIQNDEFAALVLNRDVWSDKELRQLIERKFVFWQVDNDNPNGRRFATYYHCTKYPYICVVDPRTGQKVWQCTDGSTTLAHIKEGLRAFLRAHQLGDETPSTSNKRKMEQSAAVNGFGDCPTAADDAEAAPIVKRVRYGELSEEEQIALAIKNSMKEQQKTAVTNGKSRRRDCDDADSDVEDDENSEDDDEDYADADAESDSDNNDAESLAEYSPSKIVENDQNEDAENKAVIDVDVERPASHATSSKCPSYSDLLGRNTAEQTRMRIRLVDDTPQQNDINVQLTWPSDTPLRALRAYLRQEQPHIPSDPERYRIICAFPRKTLDADANDDTTLRELDFHPSVNLHIIVD